LLLSEHLCSDVLLKLPHSQYVFTLPKSLRVFFKNDRKLFSGISKIIFSLLSEYFTEAEGIKLQTGVIISYQSYGDKLRFNSHWHCIVLDGGFDENGDFYYASLKKTDKMVELFRQRVISYMLKEKFLNPDFAKNLLSWVNSGFSVDNSIKLFIYDEKIRENITQYIIRHPLSLQNIVYVKEKGTVIYHNKYNKYWGENTKVFKAADFIAELTQHIPPKGMHLIRYYGIYSSRTRGKQNQINDKKEFVPLPEKADKSEKKSKQSWARLLKKVYEVDPLLCPKCGGEMKIIAIITEKSAITNILEYLAKNKAPPFDEKTA
jgi:hypothetical protein